MRIKSPADFWTGVLFGGFGLFAAIYAQRREVLSPVRFSAPRKT
jgi:hypothetical protein